MQGTALPEPELSLRTELTFQDISLQILGKTRDEVIRGINNLVLDSKIRISIDMHRIIIKMILNMVRVTNNARYLNRLDPTGRYTDTGYQEYESNANPGHDYQDEYQDQYQNQYPDQVNGYPLN